jgi:hypothetical protein
MDLVLSYLQIPGSELPQVVHEAGCLLREVEGAAIFTIQCQECGGVCCYADDNTYTATGNDPVELSEKLSQKYADSKQAQS